MIAKTLVVFYVWSPGTFVPFNIKHHLQALCITDKHSSDHKIIQITVTQINIILLYLCMLNSADGDIEECNVLF